MLNDAWRKEFAKTLCWALLALFLVPAITLGFTAYSLKEDQAQLDRALAAHLEKQTNMPAAEQQDTRDFYARHPLAKLCRDRSEEAVEFRADQCPTGGELWQFTWMHTLALAALVGGVLILLWLATLGWLAFAKRGLQYTSFVTGWRTLTAVSVATVLAQGAMLVWLSFWVTAYFSQKYYPKLIIVAAIAVAGAAFVVLAKIFHRSAEGSSIDGELVTEADAPRLWQRIRDVAARLKTPAPDHLVAGIDANFFVTEAPLAVGERTLEGRKLYVSVPLLRQLDREEADAVLAHELAHLSGGDARSSAQLGPKLSQFDRYMAHLYEGGLARVALPLLELYRMVFQVALSRDSRAREFRADKIASRLVSPRAISHSLIKIAAYASYRNDVERGLFSRQERLDDQLGIGHRVATGLPGWAGTPAFVSALADGHIPHPYDSHPPLRERMASVKHVEAQERFAEIVTRPVADTWADDIGTAAQIEARLWAEYEQGFSADHEQQLAYRYVPNTAQERALVLKYFPDQVFQFKKDRTVHVTYAAITPAEGEPPVAWGDIKAMEFSDKAFRGEFLVIKLNEKGLITAKTVTISVAGLKGEERARFNAVIGHYWQRDQYMRAYQAASDQADD